MHEIEEKEFRTICKILQDILDVAKTRISLGSNYGWEALAIEECAIKGQALLKKWDVLEVDFDA